MDAKKEQLGAAGVGTVRLGAAGSSGWRFPTEVTTNTTRFEILGGAGGLIWRGVRRGARKKVACSVEGVQLFIMFSEKSQFLFCNL